MKTLRGAGSPAAHLLNAPFRRALLAPGCDGPVNDGGLGDVAVRQVKKVSCEDCFFRKNMLCALSLDEACPTIRPDHPDGLRPPQQLRFVFRQERRRQAAWAFPDAEQQAALHA